MCISLGKPLCMFGKNTGSAVAAIECCVIFPCLESLVLPFRWLTGPVYAAAAAALLLLLLRRFGDAALNLLEGLLALDPKRRVTARQALQHRYFQMKPLPSVPGM